MSVKWGVLGTAGIAKGCTIPGMLLAKNCELYAVAGRNEERARRYKEEFGFEKYYVGYENLLNDPEVQAVYVPLPNHLHAEWAIKALKAGKHVLVEKPMAMNAKEAEELANSVEDNGGVSARLISLTLRSIPRTTPRTCAFIRSRAAERFMMWAVIAQP